MKKAFTLTEIIITITIVGILATVTLQALQKVEIKQYQNLYKKAFDITHTIVNDLISNNEYNYDTPSGLSDTTKVIKNNITYEGNKKFCNLFALEMKTISNYDCNENLNAEFTDNVVLETGTFTTIDNIIWIVNDDVNRWNNDQLSEIHIDVNGNKAPNEWNVDRFKISISKYGEVSPTSDIEKSILNNI